MQSRNKTIDSSAHQKSQPPFCQPPFSLFGEVSTRKSEGSTQAEYPVLRCEISPAKGKSPNFPLYALYASTVWQRESIALAHLLPG